MGDALPHASCIGCIGTPIELRDPNTRAVFGDYISIYDIQRAVQSRAPVELRNALQPRLLSGELREKHFHNRVFDSLDAVEDHLVSSLRNLELDHERVCGITAWSWIIDAVSNAN